MNIFDDLINPEDSKISNLPINIPGIEISNSPDSVNGLYTTNPPAPTNPLGQTILAGKETVPVASTLKNPVKKAGILEQIGHEAFNSNNLALAGQFVYDSIKSFSSTDEVPEGWTALSLDAVEGFPRNYWEYLTDAKSPNDLLARQQRVRVQMADDEKFKDGSIIAKLIGGFIGVGLDPATYLLPLASSAKYATIGQNVLMNMGRASGSIALESVSRNMLIQADRAGGTIQEAATDALRDTIFGTHLVGAGAGVGHLVRESHLWEMRRVMNATADGVKIDKVVNKDGIITDIRASMMPGVPMNAAAVDAANLYVNENMKMGGVFKAPFIGKPLKNFLGWGKLASPVFQNLNSPYSSVKNFFNRIASHGVILEGEEEGVARTDTASDFLEQYRDEAKSLTNFIRGKYFEANGLEGGANVKNALKNFQQTISNNKTISNEQFGIEVRNIAYVKDYKSDYSQAHQVADAVLGFFEKMGIDYHNAVGTGGEFLDPKNAWKYLPQNYNIPAMINQPDKWQDTLFIELSKQDARIKELESPIRDAEELVNSLGIQLKEAQSMANNEARIRYLKNQLRSAKSQVGRYENELVNKLRTNPDDSMLLQDRIMFDEKEREQFNTILEPMREAERQKTIIESKLKPFLKEQKARPKNNKIAMEVKALREELKIAEEEILNQKQLLEDAARDKKLDRKYFHEVNGEIVFHEPNRKPQFRKVFATDHERTMYVRQAYDAIVGQSPEDILQNVLGSISPGIIENPKYLHARTIPINSQAFNEIGMLDPDISKSVTAYANTMGKVIAFKKAFPEFSEGKAFEGPLRKFKEEHEQRRNKILQDKDSPERRKKLNKIEKEYRQAEELMSNTYKVFMGTYDSGSPKLLQFTRGLKNLVAASKLGAVPVYQIAELGAIIMKQGLMPFLAQGLRPMIKSLNRFDSLGQEERKVMRDNAANAHLALYNVQNGYAELFVNRNSMSSPPVKSIWGKLGVATENLAHMSGNLFGINAIANMNEQIAANLFQSEVMQVMFAHEAGTITKKQIQKMAHYGIEVDKWSKRFIKGYKESGGWEIAGGHQSQYYKWQDAEAANRMSLSMRRMVHDTVVNRNAFSSPYWSNNPLGSMVFMFHGWAYGALNHYAIPLMQRPDAENMLGLITVVGLSMMSEPFLRIANGKPAYDDDTSWFDEAYKAIDYSGILGPYASMLQDANNVLGGSLIPRIQTERYKNRGAGLSGLVGPVAGYVNDAAQSIYHGYKGDFTQNDAKRFERLLPFSSHLGVRGIVNNYIENSGLPAKRGQAHAWNWRETIYGENK